MHGHLGGWVCEVMYVFACMLWVALSRDVPACFGLSGSSAEVHSPASTTHQLTMVKGALCRLGMIHMVFPAFPIELQCS